MDKLKKNKILTFILILSLIAFLFGIIFITIISKSDILTLKTYINNFFNNIYNNNINFSKTLFETLTFNLIVVIIIWILGMSVIGLPFIIFIYFFKFFSLGFSLSSFILVYKLKGLIISFLYLFPNELIKYFLYTLLVFNSIKIAKAIILLFIKKKNIDFNCIIYKYFKILIFCIILCIIFSIYETFAIPFIFNKLYLIIK